MAFYKNDIVDINLEDGNIHRSFLSHTIGSGDQSANRFGIRAYRDGVPVDLSGASCQAVFMNAAGTNIALTSYGTVSGNEAYVTLPQACYNVEGQFCLAIKLVQSSVTVTMRIVDGVVSNTGTTGSVAPTSSVPTYQEILDTYAAMTAATAAANTAIAETFDATKAYPAGKYVINSGALYRLTADHAANVTWANTSKVATNFGDEATSLKSALFNITENMSIDVSAKKQYINLAGSTVTMSGGVPQYSGSSAQFDCTRIQCSAGDQFTINGTGGAQTRLWGFIDSSGNVLTKADANATGDGLVIEAPTDATWLIIHDKTGSVSYYGVLVKNKLYDLIPAKTFVPDSVMNSQATGKSLFIKNIAKDSVVKPIIDLSLIQSGSGTPTPSNIRNVVPWNSFAMDIHGKNLFSGTIAQIAFSSHKIVTGTSYRSIYQQVEGGKYYTVSRKSIEGNRFQVTTTATTPVANVATGEYVIDDTNTKMSLTVYVPTGYYIVVYLDQAGATITADNYQIEEGYKATEIEPYFSSDVEISIPNGMAVARLEYYGENIWKLTKTASVLTLTGNETITSLGLTDYGTRFRIDTTLPFVQFANVSAWASIFAASNAFSKSGTGSADASNVFWWNTSATQLNIIYGPSGTATSVDDFKTFLRNNTIVIVGQCQPETTDIPGEKITVKGSTYVESESVPVTIRYAYGENENEADQEDVYKYVPSTTNMLGNVSIRAAKTINFNDGTPPVNEWYLLQDTNDCFYMSHDLQSKRMLFMFHPTVGGTADWAFGIDTKNNIYAIPNAAAYGTTTGLDDSMRTANPIVYLSAENWEFPHEIDFGTSFKPVGWLSNVGWCVLPNNDIVFCEYTRPVVKTCNVWHIDGTNPTDASNWTRTWSHDIVTNEQSSTGIKHVHCVQYDFFENVVYFATGDSDVGSFIYHSTDNGLNWTLTYGPNQNLCRMLNFVFTKNKVYWGSDSYTASEHHFMIADRNSNGIIDVENAVQIDLGAVNNQACYGSVYLHPVGIIVLLDRNDTMVPGDWQFELQGYDVVTGTIKTLGFIKPVEGQFQVGFRTTFIDWYPRSNMIRAGFSPTVGSTGNAANQMAVCGNQGGQSGDGSTRINNVELYVYREANGDCWIEFSTLNV